MSDLIGFDVEQERNARVARDIARHDEILRECFKRKLDDIDADAVAAQKYCHEMMRSGADVSEELAELETTARALLLVALAYKREAA